MCCNVSSILSMILCVGIAYFLSSFSGSCFFPRFCTSCHPYMPVNFLPFFILHINFRSCCSCFYFFFSTYFILSSYVLELSFNFIWVLLCDTRYLSMERKLLIFQNNYPNRILSLLVLAGHFFKYLNPV